MYLELSITDSGNGYVSTFSDEGKSLSCKPTATHVINDMLDEYQKSELFRIDSFGGSDGSERHVIKEKLNRNFKSENPKTEVEFNRYKQDCRKRALDLAHSEINNGMAKKLADGNETKDVAELADKYYNWLISIPNE